jgi:hypothetical protein
LESAREHQISIVLAKRAKFQHFGTETPFLEQNSKTQNQIGTVDNFEKTL